MNPLIITGATGSIGAVAVEEMAQEGRPIIIACRNLDKGAALIEKVKSSVPDAMLDLRKLDLSSRNSVREFVRGLDGVTIAGLFNNAGVLPRYYSVTEDGTEQTMTVNYLNTVLLTRLLLPQMEDRCKVVNMVSLVTKLSDIDLDWPKEGEKEFGQLRTYAKSKLALLYFSIALSKHYPRLRVNVSDPGIVNSEMIRLGRWFDPLTDVIFRPFINSPEKGAKPAISALHAEDSLRYYVGKHADPIPEKFMKSYLIDPLWEQATEMLGLQG